MKSFGCSVCRSRHYGYIDLGQTILGQLDIVQKSAVAIAISSSTELQHWCSRAWWVRRDLDFLVSDDSRALWYEVVQYFAVQFHIKSGGIQSLIWSWGPVKWQLRFVCWQWHCLFNADVWCNIKFCYIWRPKLWTENVTFCNSNCGIGGPVLYVYVISLPWVWKTCYLTICCIHSILPRTIIVLLKPSIIDQIRSQTSIRVIVGQRDIVQNSAVAIAISSSTELQLWCRPAW